jgi:hypothetical protein
MAPSEAAITTSIKVPPTSKATRNPSLLIESIVSQGEPRDATVA